MNRAERRRAAKEAPAVVGQPDRSYEEYMCWRALSIMAYERGGGLAYPVTDERMAKINHSRIVVVGDPNDKSKPWVIAIGQGNNEVECNKKIEETLAAAGVPVIIPRTN